MNRGAGTRTLGARACESRPYVWPDLSKVVSVLQSFPSTSYWRSGLQRNVSISSYQNTKVVVLTDFLSRQFGPLFPDLRLLGGKEKAPAVRRSTDSLLRLLGPSGFHRTGACHVNTTLGVIPFLEQGHGILTRTVVLMGDEFVVVGSLKRRGIHRRVHCIPSCDVRQRGVGKSGIGKCGAEKFGTRKCKVRKHRFGLFYRDVHEVDW